MIDGYEIVKGNNSGNFTGGGYKLVLHTTEGSTAEGAISAYKKNNSWPHFTLDPKKRRKIQHLETNVAARSLYNDTSDGFQVGRANAIQAELVGFAKDTPNLSKDDLDWLAATFNEIRDNIKNKNGATFALQAPTYVPVGQVSPFSDKDWVSYSGIPGHQHAPDNKSVHTDPGKIDIQYILGRLKGNIMVLNWEEINRLHLTYFQTPAGEADKAFIGKSLIEYLNVLDKDVTSAPAIVNSLKTFIKRAG